MTRDYGDTPVFTSDYGDTPVFTSFSICATQPRATRIAGGPKPGPGSQNQSGKDGPVTVILRGVLKRPLLAYQGKMLSRKAITTPDLST